MKKIIILLITIICIGLIIVGCGSEEIENSELDDKLRFNENIELTGSLYETNKDKIDIQLDYKGDVLRVGTINHIRNTVEMEFKDEYKEINLLIIQEDPFDSVNYLFKDNKWDEDVE